MSDESPTQETPETPETQKTVDMLCAGVEELQMRTAERIKSMRRRTKVTWAIGIALALTSYFTLSSVTSLIERLDADAAVQIARIKVEEYLPSARKVYQEHLEREAPRLVSEALRAMIDVLPRARSFLVADLGKRLDVINGEFETRANVTLLETVRSSKAQIESIYPDKPDREKLELLIATISSDFGTVIFESNQELYPHYSREMSRIRSEIAILRDTPDEQLTDEQRSKRDIIVTILHLAMREAMANGESSTGFPVPFSRK